MSLVARSAHVEGGTFTLVSDVLASANHKSIDIAILKIARGRCQATNQNPEVTLAVTKLFGGKKEKMFAFPRFLVLLAVAKNHAGLERSTANIQDDRTGVRRTLGTGAIDGGDKDSTSIKKKKAGE